MLHAREEPLSLTISTGVINLHQTPRYKNPISVSQWTDAFLVFTSVYIEKFPHQAPHLLKYAHMIREIQRLHGDNAFRSYDEQFRKLKESVNVPWQNPIQELRLRAATLPKTYNKPSQNQSFRGKFCFQYNKGDQCTRNPCSFRHSCMQCKGNHPKSKCTESSKSQNSYHKSSNPVKIEDLIKCLGGGTTWKNLKSLKTGFHLAFI